MILLFIVLFPLMWCGISLLIAFLSGWSRLAERYRHDARIECKFFYCQSGKIGGVDFNSCLTLGVSERGLLMSVLLPFRAGHPPLPIPWSDFHDVQEKRTPIFGFRSMTARLGIASMLLEELIRRAEELNIDCITTEASITAKPFFIA
ncbi:GNAT family protein [Novipirellula artificiosorum]|uniref:Uncharacterized protein n=1 Tax=Novipirellula artificiosorum TaxID=2528016 RepID=A0A5C6DCG3_9BACT|nr:hypothetical protein [Novipirellula artificiosorum]TWU32629.1 hypothetical protein Poly41_56070 [Novipirellula artificiosorum]